MTQASVPAPSTNLTAFACPNCGAHATQHWYRTHIAALSGDNPVPNIWTLEAVEELEANIEERAHGDKDHAVMEIYAQRFRRTLTGEPFIVPTSDDVYRPPVLENVFVSHCFTCDKAAIWLHDRLLYPPSMTAPSPNLDLSQDVLCDYSEARKILDLSPRGAAALLRLAVEKICIELKAEGKTIDQRIEFLVSRGLPKEVQQALDTVRVIGNEAVHPGQVDLRDDRDTASKLFDLVNFIAEDRITRPKQVAALYSMIPEEKRKAIDARNAKATGNQS